MTSITPRTDPDCEFLSERTKGKSALLSRGLGGRERAAVFPASYCPMKIVSAKITKTRDSKYSAALKELVVLHDTAWAGIVTHKFACGSFKNMFGFDERHTTNPVTQLLYDEPIIM